MTKMEMEIVMTCRRISYRRIRVLAGLLTVAVFVPVGTAHGQVSSVSPAALLAFPYLTIDRSAGVDTVVQLTNTSDAPVEVRCVLEETTPACVDGAGSCVGTVLCTGSCQPTHTATPFRLRLTANQPIGWALTGGLSTGPIAGAASPAASGDSDLGTQVPAVTHDPFVGILRCVVVDDYGMPVERNVLTGTASIETSETASGRIDSASYNAIGIAALAGAASSPSDDWLALGGPHPEYAACPSSLVVPTLFDGATIGTDAEPRTVATTLALVPCGGNVLNDAPESVIQLLTYNELGQRLSTSISMRGQLVRPISNFDTTQSERSIMHVAVEGTLTGQIYLNPVVGNGVLGIALERHSTDGPDRVTHQAATGLFAEGARREPAYAGLLNPPCGGDCNGDGRVTIDELLRAVNIALDAVPVTACAMADTNRNGAVIINELTGAVNSALSGCPERQVNTPIEQPTVTPTPQVPPSGVGAQITYLGIASPDDIPRQPIGDDDAGRPIYRWPVGQGLSLIIEARRGTSNRPVGLSARAASETDLPDLQVIVSRPLGDGSGVVCDADFPDVGGVPATEPFDLDNAAAAPAINDLGCRADDGMGKPKGRAGQFCTRDAQTRSGVPASAITQAQFCIPIAKAWAFPAGDTIVAARVRDVGGETGSAREMVIRIDSAP